MILVRGHGWRGLFSWGFEEKCWGILPRGAFRRMIFMLRMYGGRVSLGKTTLPPTLRFSFFKDLSSVAATGPA